MRTVRSTNQVHPGRTQTFVLGVLSLALFLVAFAGPTSAWNVDPDPLDRLIADAGPDQVARKHTVVWLDGRSSYDELGQAITFEWSQLEGPRVTLVGAREGLAHFVPAVSGQYGFGLLVCAEDGTCAADDVQVRVRNLPPTAVPSGPLSAIVGSRVVLTGTSSWDPDHDTLLCEWSQLSGPPVQLEGADRPVASFIATSVGTYTFQLRVTDGDGGEDARIAAVVVGPPPAVTVTFPPPGAVLTSGTLRVAGHAEEAAQVRVRIGGGPWQEATGLPGWSATLDISRLADGEHVVEARASRGSFESQPAFVTVHVAIPPPFVTIDSLDDVALRGSVRLTGTATPGSLVAVSVSGNEGWVSAVDGLWEYRLDTRRVADGVHTISLQAFANGRASPEVRVTVLVANPGTVIEEPGLPGEVVAAVLALTAALGAAGVLSERGRGVLFWPFIYLWLKLRREMIFENETRGLIRGYLSANPGANFTAIRDDLKLANGTLEYHLRVMSRHGLIESWADGRFRRFALAGQRIASIQPKLTDVELLLLQMLQERPGLYQAEIATEMGLSRPTISYHMKKLTQIGVVTATRSGVRKRYHPVVGAKSRSHRRQQKAESEQQG